MEKVIVVIGPTSVGKTKMGVALAKKFNGEVISGCEPDSREPRHRYTSRFPL